MLHAFAQICAGWQSPTGLLKKNKGGEIDLSWLFLMFPPPLSLSQAQKFKGLTLNKSTDQLYKPYANGKKYINAFVFKASGKACHVSAAFLSETLRRRHALNFISSERFDIPLRSRYISHAEKCHQNRKANSHMFNACLKAFAPSMNPQRLDPDRGAHKVTEKHKHIQICCLYLVNTCYCMYYLFR